MPAPAACYSRPVRFALAGAAMLLATLAATSSGFAQYYPPGFYPPQPRYEEEPRYDPRYNPRYREQPRYYSDPNDGYAPRPRRGRLGNVCVTSRGECEYGPVPLGSGCSCHIPGFGKKRGSVQY